MKLTILGNYGPYPKKGGATSGYLLESFNSKILLDCGSGVLSNLQKHERPENLDAIIISHTHFDHIADLGVFNYYFELLQISGNSKKIKLYLPQENENVLPIIKAGRFEVVFYGENDEIFIGKNKITFKRVKHPVLTYACEISGEEKFCYTADTNFCQEVEDLFKNNSVLLCDGLFLENNWAENKPHMSIKGICALAKKYNKKVIISHFSPKVELKEYKKEASGNYILAKINKTYTL